MGRGKESHKLGEERPLDRHRLHKPSGKWAGVAGRKLKAGWTEVLPASVLQQRCRFVLRLEEVKTGPCGERVSEVT